MKLQLRHHFPGVKAEVACNPRALLRCGVVGGERPKRDECEGQEGGGRRQVSKGDHWRSTCHAAAARRTGGHCTTHCCWYNVRLCAIDSTRRRVLHAMG